MYYVYVLRSQKTDKKYVGSTGLLPEVRAAEHNGGKVPWTRSHRPLKLIYFESFQEKNLAIKREKFFKSGKGRTILKSLLSSRPL